MIATPRPSDVDFAAKVKSFSPGMLLFAGFLALIITLQVIGGAYQAEFGGYPDEPAHYVTSLMVRDYIAGMQYGEPMEYARNYYDHYPKVAMGHWPPFLYLVQALWMLIFSASRTSILIQMACMTALLAWMVSTAVKRRFGWKAGALAGFLLICLPITQTYTAEVMAETLLVVVSFAAAIFFARYLETERWQDSAWFGLFASLAILTKGSGWDLAIIPPVAIFLTRKYRLLARWTFWLPVGIVGLLCGPWQVMTLQMAERGWTGGEQPNVAFTFQALGIFLKVMASLLSYSLAPLVLIGFVVTVAIPYFRSRVEPEWATMAALILAVWVFHSVVPAGIEERKLIVAIPALILFLFAGGSWLAGRFKWNPAIVAAAGILLFLGTGFSLVRETHYGFIEAAEFIDSRPDLHDKDVLVSSLSDGEGMLISELAMREKRFTHHVLRGTKALSRADWNGARYECFLHNPDDLMQYLREAKVGTIVLDTFPARIAYDHERIIREGIAKYSDHFRLIGTFAAAGNGTVQVYKVN
jgi:Dolichyl-phosphate-mannose-protein mannosyltransferase